MNLRQIIDPSWQPIIGMLNQEPLLTLNQEVLPDIRYYPVKENIFRVFQTPVHKIKVVILGQDPYHGPGQANGLAFAVNPDTPIPPSLKVIMKEIENEGVKVSDNHTTPWKTLEHWQEQGVFLLNTALTVEASKPGSHTAYWEDFMKRLVHFIAEVNPCIWMLWGNKAKAFSVYINNNPFNVIRYGRESIENIPGSPYYNYILSAAHPAAEAYNQLGNAGFYGCEHFYFANKILSKTGKESINW